MIFSVQTIKFNGKWQDGVEMIALWGKHLPLQFVRSLRRVCMIIEVRLLWQVMDFLKSHAEMMPKGPILRDGSFS